jgi:hypothetical protein
LKEQVNLEYTQLALIIILMGMTVVVVGFLDVILVILGCDVALIVAVLPLGERTHKLMKKKESKSLIKVESPLNWLKSCAIFAFVSIIAGLCYETMNIIGIESNAPIFGNPSLLIFAISFFVLALIHILRITVFMIDPASKANIFAGKLIYKALQISMQVILLFFLASLQVFNGLIFPLIINGIVLQNIFPIPLQFVFHFWKQVKRWDWAIMFSFFSPWIIIIIVGTMLQIGIKLV